VTATNPNFPGDDPSNPPPTDQVTVPGRKKQQIFTAGLVTINVGDCYE
jgi:hypothetical protein